MFAEAQYLVLIRYSSTPERGCWELRVSLVRVEVATVLKYDKRTGEKLLAGDLEGQPCLSVTRCCRCPGRGRLCTSTSGAADPDP